MEKEWTIIILIYADFHIDGSEKLTRELSALIGDINFCQLTEKNELLIIYNQIRKIPEDSSNISDKTFVLRAVMQKFGINKLEMIDEIASDHVTQKPDVLGKIFYKINNNHFSIDRTKINTKAQRYFLLTWDHGAGFGIFRRDSESLRKSLSFNFGNNLSIHKQRFDFNQNRNVQLLGLEYPKSVFQDKNDKLVFIERKKDSPVAFYAVPKEKLVFQLNTYYEKQKIAHKLLSEQLLTEQIKIWKESDKLFFLFENNAVDPDTNFLSQWINDEEFNLIKEHFQFENQKILYSLNLLELIQNKIVDVLTNEELNSAIQTGFEKRKLDVVLMMNCYMMNIHTLYALKDSVDILIAPQGGIDEPGYNYASILSGIYTSALAIKPLELSNSCVRTCIGNLPGRTSFEDTIDEWAIFQTNTNYQNIATKIDGVAKFCLDANDLKFMNSIRDIRNLCIKFDIGNANYYLIDFCHWICHLIKHLQEHYDTFDITFLQNAFNDIKNELSKTVIKPSLIGKSIYDPNTPDGMFEDDPTTVGIYFPSDIDKSQNEYVYFVSPDAQDQSLFLKEMKNWLLFLEAL